MPYGTVNLLKGVNPTETPVTCTAGIGTYIIEFATLSRLTGDPEFERVARRALKGLWESRSEIGLVRRKCGSFTLETILKSWSYITLASARERKREVCLSFGSNLFSQVLLSFC